MTRRIAALATAAALAVGVLAGCGDATDRATQDRRAAFSARLETANLPGRWEALPNGGTLNCPELAGAVGTARSASDLLLGEGGSVDNVIFLFNNALAAEVRMHSILTPESRRCIGREMWDGAVAPVPSAPLTVRPVGDAVEAARFTLPPDTEDIDVLDVVVVRIGRGVVVVEVASDAARLDAGLRDAVVAAAVRKLRVALDG